MNMFQLHNNGSRYAIALLLLLGHFTSFGMQLSRKQHRQQEDFGRNKAIMRSIRYSLDCMPREMQVPIFCQSGLSFDDKKNLSLINKTSHQNMRENVLLYRPIPSRGTIFAIDTFIYVTGAISNVGTIGCSIV